MNNIGAMFEHVRNRRTGLFPNRIYVKQVQGIEGIIKSAQENNCTLLQTAYILGTTHLETAGKYDPEIREFGRGRGRPYGVPAGPYNEIYYGRSLPQITWLDNYRKMSEIYDHDFVKNPDDVMLPEYAFDMAVRGMMEGWWTGRKLPNYLNDTTRDYYEARTCINGHDKWDKIRDYTYAWQDALIIGGYDDEPEKENEVTQPVPTKPWYASRGVWGAIISLVATALHVFANISLTEGVQDQLVEIIIAVLGGSGGVLAMIGRLLASQKIA